MARLDWGETTAETIHMLKATIQTHENLLLGNTEDKIDGVVPTVNDLMVKLRFSKNLGIILNALILLILGIEAWRNEAKTPIVIYQPQPQAVQHKSYSDAPQMQAGQEQQSTEAGQTHY